MRESMRFGVMASLIATALAANGQASGPDQVVPVVVPGSSISANLAAFAYDPTTDSMFLTAFGNPAMLKVTDVRGTPLITPTVFESTLQLYYRNGNPDRGVTTPTQGGILLNPLPVGGRAPYSFALIADGGNTRFPASNTVDPAATKKFYAYNLQTAAIPGDGTDVFTTRATLADLQAVSGATSTSNTLSRQFAWSGDGQSIYFVDSSSANDGVWQLGAVSGLPQRILAANLENTEPGVFSSGGVDRIYFSGITGDTGIGNAGGIDFITHDGTTTSAAQVAVSAAKLRDFFEVGENMSSQRIGSVAFHVADMYFSLFNTNSGTNPLSRFQGIYRLDAEGRLSKVANRTERAAAFNGSVNQVFDHFQPREIEYTGSAESFPVTQILYRESGANAVAGAIAFKPGDFNRDNTVTAADVDLFRQQVTSRGVLVADVANLKFDMNGNDVVDWKDVQILEQFLDYLPDPALAGRVIPELPIKADTNLDGLVDFADFLIMRDNYAPAVIGRSFVVGDSSGDDRVDFADLQPWVNSAGYRSAVIGAGVPETPFDQAEWDAFLATLTPPDVVLDVASGTSTQFEEGYRSIVIAASVIKTGGGAVVFDGANSYSGTTVVAEGSLIIDPRGTFGTSPLIDVRAGATLDASGLAGGLAVADGQTLAGSGTVLGSVVFGQGSTLAPGLNAATISSPGSLSSGGTVAIVPEPGFTPLAVVAAVTAAAGLAVRRRTVRGNRR